MTLLSGVTKAPQSLSTATGAVTVFVPADADLDFGITTSGAITTDYSLDIEHHDHQEPDKIASARIGAGGPKLTLASTRGSVALRRVAVPGLPAPGR